MVLVGNPGSDSFGDIGAAEDHAALVVHADDIAMLDAAFLGFARVDPDGLVQIAIDALDLAGRDFPQPGNVIMLGMQRHSVVRLAKQADTSCRARQDGCPGGFRLQGYSAAQEAARCHRGSSL